MTRSLTPALLMCMVLALSAAPASAQGVRERLVSGGATEPTRVLSTNPIGLAVRYLNVEYETRVRDRLTTGIGASHLPASVGLGSYFNGDLFVRYYLTGRTFSGLSVDLKTGLTTVGDGRLGAGAGFDVNASSRVNDRVVVSAGFGLKRVFAGADTYVLPTVRLVNVGIAF